MAKKRGGLAGIWDRNKGVIKALAPMALGAIPGVGVPLAAAAGAAMGGLDRPGKGGIGLDIGGALKGGATGYLGGQTGKALAGGVKGLLTAGQTSPLDTLAPTDMASKVGMTGPANLPAANMASKVGMTGPANLPAANMASKVGMTPGFGAAQAGAGTPSVAAMPNVLKGAAESVAKGAGEQGFLSKAAGFARENKDLIAMAGRGIQSMMPAPGEEASMMNAETNRMRLEEEQRQSQMEEERKRRIAELLMPYIQQNYGSLFPRQG
jgi:hypothetical protein